MNKAALIIPYFGQWPEWIELYLYSCSKQKGIDFIFYTDCELPHVIYSNTFFHEISFADYCTFVSKRLSIQFHPQNAYKLCDLKVFYGIIHQQDLRNYEWWGFGDIDLIYGNLSLLVNESNMTKYDLLTTHVDRIAGHFTIMRKQSRYTKLCLAISCWKEKLSDIKNYGLDENDFTRMAMPLKYKIIGQLYYHCINRFTHPDSKHYWFHKLEKMLCVWKSNMLMREFFTTFKPKPGLSCVYNLSTSGIECPTGQISRILTGGVYIYILCASRKHRTTRQNTIGEMDFIKYQKNMISLKVA